MNRESVSIIIVTYNNETDIEKCLRSFEEQSYPFCEVIVYDNASTDRTAEMIRRQFPHVCLIQGKENIGFAAANNLAAAQAQGSILAFINPDAYVDPNWLEPLVEALTAQPQVGAVTPAIHIAEKPDVLNAYGNRVHFSGITYCYQYGRPNTRRFPFEIEALSGAAFAIRKSLYDQLKGLEPTFFMYYEDTDLSLRIHKLGLKILVVPASNVYHSFKERFHPQKILYLERNRYLSLFSLIPWQVLLLMLPTLLTVEVLVWGYCIKEGPNTVRGKLQAWVEVIKKRQWIKERRTMDASTTVHLHEILAGFHEDLELAYMNQGFLATGAAKIGWLSAAPFVRLGRWMSQRSQPHTLSPELHETINQPQGAALPLHQERS